MLALLDACAFVPVSKVEAEKCDSVEVSEKIEVRVSNREQLGVLGVHSALEKNWPRVEHTLWSNGTLTKPL